MPSKLQQPTTILGVAVAELSNLLTLYELALTLNDSELLARMRQTQVYPAIHNLKVSVFSNICLGIDALFDPRQDSVDIRRVANAVVHKDERKLILEFHGKTSQETRADAERMIERVSYLKKRLSKGRVAEALSHVQTVRNQRLAHFDFEGGSSRTTLSLRHIQICLVNAGRMADLLCRLLVQRAYEIATMRDAARKDARALRDALFRGVTLDSPPHVE